MTDESKPKPPSGPATEKKAPPRKKTGTGQKPAAADTATGEAKAAPKPAAAKKPAPAAAAKPAATAKPAEESKPAVPATPPKTAKGGAKKEKVVPDGVEPEEEYKKKNLPPPTKDMSRKELALQYEPYVRSISGTIWKTLSKDIEFEDLVSYGMLGLFEAYDRFDAKFGASFMTFSYYRIRGSIYDGLRGMGWVSRSEYARHRTEARANAYLQSQHDRDMAPVGGEANRKAGSDEQTIEEMADVVSSLVTIYVTALDAMEGFQIKDERGPAIDESLELIQDREIVKNAVEKLPDQERQLIQLYYYKELSLEDVGKQLGLSKSWTSRLHTRAIDKLTRVLKSMVDEHWAEGQGALAK